MRCTHVFASTCRHVVRRKCVRPVAVSVGQGQRSPTHGGVSMLARRLLSCARAYTRAWLVTAMPGSRALTPAAYCCHHTPCHVRHAAARGTVATAHRLAAQPARLASAPVVCRARFVAQRCISAASGATSPVSEAAAAPAGDVPAPAGAQATTSSHKVVTFYCLTRVEDPHGEVEKHKAFCQVCASPETGPARVAWHSFAHTHTAAAADSTACASNAHSATTSRAASTSTSRASTPSCLAAAPTLWRMRSG